MNSIILKEFSKEYNIPFEINLNTLVQNYNWCDMSETINFLNWTIYENNLSLVNLRKILSSCVSDQRYILETGQSYSVSIETLEDILYQQAYNSELDAYHVSIEFLSNSNKRTIRNLQSIATILRTVANNQEVNQIKSTIAYILQMFDNNILSISPYASSDINVVGYSLFIKPEEQSLHLLPIRYYEYIPFICKLEEYCVQTNHEILAELNTYLSSKSCTIDKSTSKKLYTFIEQLLAIGQLPSDWKISYIGKRTEGIDIIEIQQSYVNDYMKYLKS
jgi:hypothetical protein